MTINNPEAQEDCIKTQRWSSRTEEDRIPGKYKYTQMKYRYTQKIKKK
jgi:hypothetical protein